MASDDGWKVTVHYDKFEETKINKMETEINYEEKTEKTPIDTSLKVKRHLRYGLNNIINNEKQKANL
jgi:hypothetical protein